VINFFKLRVFAWMATPYNLKQTKSGHLKHVSNCSYTNKWGTIQVCHWVEMRNGIHKFSNAVFFLFICQKLSIMTKWIFFLFPYFRKKQYTYQQYNNFIYVPRLGHSYIIKNLWEGGYSSFTEIWSIALRLLLNRWCR
jgi:hypothetical protein